MLDEKAQVQKFNGELRLSGFHKSFYSVDLSLHELIRGLLFYLDRQSARAFEAGEITPNQAVSLVMDRVPEFQRDADKWSPDMQKNYVHNVLRGYRGSPLSFYTLSNQGKDQCLILDGLQRITALCRFECDQDMEFPLSDGTTVRASTLLNPENDFNSLWNLVVPVRVYTFNAEIEAVDFYIEMNECITHSPEDIKKARDYRATL